MNFDSEDSEIYYIAENVKEDFTRRRPSWFIFQSFAEHPVAQPASGQLRKDNQITGGGS